MTNSLGWLATVCFASCYVPQLIRTLKRKEVGDISVWSWVIQIFGYVIGLVYGAQLHQAPLLVGYGWGLLCTFVFLFMYWRYR